MPESEPQLLQRAFTLQSAWLFWLPLWGTCLAILLCFLSMRGDTVCTDILAFFAFVGVLYFFVAMIVFFVKKRVAAGLGALACLFAAGGTVLVSLIGAMLGGFLD
jgi:hypothetical protein